MVDDIAFRPPYDRLMSGEEAHILVKLDTRDPVALSDFVAGFVGLGNQFEKFVSKVRPDLRAETEFFVKEVRSGCIEAELVAWVVAPPAAGGMLAIANATLGMMDKALIFEQFVNSMREKLGRYFKPGGRDSDASKGDLADFYKTVAAVAHDADGNALLEAATYEDGQRQVRTAFRFATPEAREAERQLGEHKRELEAKSDADHQRVLMSFVRPSIQSAGVGKKSGELIIIPKLHPKPLPVVYASPLAEQRLKHEIKEADDNIFKKAFDVDVNVEMRADGKPIAYRIVAVHEVIDLPDDEE